MHRERAQTWRTVVSRPKLLFATTNPAKVERLNWIREGLPFQVVTAGELAALPNSEEAGDSHRQIAEAKAVAWSRAAECLALATDGGIDIRALGPRWETLLTRRAAGPAATEELRAAYLLDLMRNLHGEAREAFWREAAALADHGQLLGSWEVQATEPMRVAHSPDFIGVPAGFYVPSLLEFPRLGRSYARLSAEERDLALNHWSQLRDLVRPALVGWLNEQSGSHGSFG